MKPMIAAGTIAVASALSSGAQAQSNASTTAPAPAPAPPACQGPEYRQFDFWIGAWEVVGTKGGKKLGDSRIELVAGGCVLLENWTGASGSTGKSLNMYDATDKQWHQSWYDSSGSRLNLAGKFADGNMVLASSWPDPAKPGVTNHQRITWTPNADGSVRQLWESSNDSGKSWTVAFDGKYIKRLTEIHVGKDFIQVAGTTMPSADALSKWLIAQNVKRVKLRIDAGVDNYEQIGKVIYTVYRSGAEVEPLDLPSPPPKP